MRLKDFITRLSVGSITLQQQKEFEEYLEKNDDIAIKLCEYDFPEIIEIICNNPNLQGKEYALKYRYVKTLYKKKQIDIETYIQSIFIKYNKEILKYISEKQLDLIISSYEERKAAIEEYRYFGDSVSKMYKNKEDKTKNNNRLNKGIEKLNRFLGNPEETLVRLLDVKQKYNENRKLRQKAFFESDISQIDYSRNEQQEILEKMECLENCIQVLETENYQLQIKVKNAEECLRE